MRLYGYAADHALLPYVFIDYASVDAPLESGKSYYPFTDLSGLPIRIEDASGEPVWTAHQTDVYGAITVKPPTTGSAMPSSIASVGPATTSTQSSDYVLPKANQR